ncbi:MAG: RNA polymerase sigma factor [Candidatus Dormibacteria bacterium]
MGSPEPDLDAWTREVQALLPDLLRYLTVFLGNREDAEDTAADVLERAWANSAEIGVPTRAWVMAVGRNLAIDQYRRRKVLSFVQLRSDDSDRSAADPNPTLSIDVRKAISTLSRSERDILALRVAGYSFDEIGKIHSKRAGAVRMTWHRASTKLEKSLLSESPTSLRSDPNYGAPT